MIKNRIYISAQKNVRNDYKKHRKILNRIWTHHYCIDHFRNRINQIVSRHTTIFTSHFQYQLHALYQFHLNLHKYIHSYLIFANRICHSHSYILQHFFDNFCFHKYGDIFNILLQPQNGPFIPKFHSFHPNLRCNQWTVIFSIKTKSIEIMIFIHNSLQKIFCQKFFLGTGFQTFFSCFSNKYKFIQNVNSQYKLIQFFPVYLYTFFFLVSTQKISFYLQSFYKPNTKSNFKSYIKHFKISINQQDNQPKSMQNNNNQPQEEVDIFSIAFNERKRVNLQKLGKFFKLRQLSILERRRIFILIQQTLYEKIQATRETIKQFIKFFEEIISWYDILLKQSKKTDLNKKTKQHCQFEAFHFRLCTIQEINIQQSDEIQGLTTWLEKTVIPALKNALDGFKDSTKVLRKQVQVIFNNADMTRHDQTRAYERIQQNNDLLENQIYFIEKIQKTDNFHIEWGQKLFKNWKQLLKQQSEVRELLRTNILEYNRRHCRIFQENEINKNINQFWSRLQKQPQIKAIFVSFLSQKDIEFISFGSKKLSFYDKLQDFINLSAQPQRVGSMLPLIEILQNKYFKCKIQKDKKQWIQTKMYFSLDQHVLIFDEEKKRLVMKISAKSIQAKKVTENMVELKGKEVGVIFDTTKKQVIHFKTVDEAEEFIFYIENIMTENNPQQRT